MMHLITQAEYARRRKVSREAVRKAIESKRITGIPHQGRVMLDPDVADIQWARNTNVDQQQRGAPGQFETTQQRAQEALQGALEMPAGPESPLLVQAKTDTEKIRRELMELELAEKRGQLVKVVDVERAYAAKLVAAREALESLPDRLAAKIAALGDATKVHVMLTEELRLAMTQLQRGRTTGLVDE